MLPGLRAALNYHPIFVHFPIVLWFAALLFELLAVSRASERILRATGAWERVLRLSPYGRMRIWHESVAPSSPRALVVEENNRFSFAWYSCTGIRG